jgi:hypothetical protein
MRDGNSALGFANHRFPLRAFIRFSFFASRHTLNVRCVLSGNRVWSAIGFGISPCSCM